MTVYSNPPNRIPFYDLPETERRAIRRAEEQGRLEGQQLANLQEAARQQAVIDATPPHLRRPDNIFTRLIAEWQSKAYRPDVAHKIKIYKEKEVEREREIEIEMADKLREFEVMNNSETKPAREHWEKANAAAESPEEKREWARLKGLIDGGGANQYWQQCQPLIEKRLAAIQQRMDEQIGKQAIVVGESKALAVELESVSELQIQTETPNREQVKE